MDDDTFYASNDRSSLDLIEREFTMSRDRSRARHSCDELDDTDRILRPEQVGLAFLIVMVVGVLLLLLKLALPV